MLNPKTFMIKCILYIITCISLLGCASGSIEQATTVSMCACPCPEEYNYSIGELDILKSRAKNGDPEAAINIYNYYLRCQFGIQDETEKKQSWLNKAALLKHPEAQRWVGYEIEERDHPYKEFGVTKKLAMYSLYSESCNSGNRAACYSLSLLYEKDSTQIDNDKKAREFMLKSANLGYTMAWKKISEYYSNGFGGPVNINEAYYWISLKSLMVNPEYQYGKELWASRKKLANEITNLETIVSIWALLDKSLFKIERGYFKINNSRCGGTTVPPKAYENCLRNTQLEDNKHKNQIKMMHNQSFKTAH